MKTRHIITPLIAVAVIVTFSGYHTGLKGTIYGLPDSASHTCGSATTCHGVSNASLTVDLEVCYDFPSTDTSLMYTHQYEPGHKYTIKVYGVNASALPDTAFGFQIALAGWKDTGSFIPVGIFDTTGLISAYDTFTKGNFRIVEQSNTLHKHITAAASAKTFQADIGWTAPSMPIVDSVYIIPVVCAVDQDGTPGGDMYNMGAPVILYRHRLSTKNILTTSNLKIYPNPFTNEFSVDNIALTQGIYQLQIFNTAGVAMLTTQLQFTNSSSHFTFPTYTWPPGYYYLSIKNTNSNFSTAIIKQ